MKRSNAAWWLVGAAMLAGAVLAVIAVGLGDLADTGPGRGSFHVSARIQTHLPQYREGQLDWWYSPEPRWRHEFDNRGERSAVVPDSVVVNDGTRTWYYYPEVNAYCSLDGRVKSPVLLTPGAMTPAFVGPSSEPTVARFIQQLQALGPGVQVRELGQETHLGRTVAVIEYSPATPPSGHHTVTVGRVWLDDSSMFVLRHIIEEVTGAVLFESDVTSLSFEKIPPSLFSFEPSAEAFEFQALDGNCDQGLRAVTSRQFNR